MKQLKRIEKTLKINLNSNTVYDQNTLNNNQSWMMCGWHYMSNSEEECLEQW